MSLAGRRSTLGDEYQLCIALHWLIQLLNDPTIKSLQVNSTGIPDSTGRPYQDLKITVDDVVIIYADDSICCIQAKKNQPQHNVWSLADRILIEELQKALKQLESRENSRVMFYSRSPFGELQALIETCRYFPDYISFQRDVSRNQVVVLRKLASIFNRSEEETFRLGTRIWSLD